MTLTPILLPVFAQIALTFALTIALVRARVGAVERREVRMKDIALNQGWSDGVTQIANAYRNQFELPLLFYALVILEWISGKADIVFVGFEWAFVASRFVHAYIHVTSNYVPNRFRAFAAGFLLLVLMWAIFAARIMAA